MNASAKRRGARLAACLAVAAALLAVAGDVTVASAAAGVRLQRVGTFDTPTYLAAPPGDNARQFVVEQPGRIRVIKNGRVLSQPFLDIRNVVGFSGERGLLSMAFAPDYARSRLFYVYFTDRTGDIRVEEFKRSPSSADVAARASRRLVLRVPHRQFGNHNGGQLQFGGDGRLYIATGDGGGGGDPLHSGQNRNSLLGKILRINPRRTSSGAPYSVPRDNPFVGRTGRDEIWHYGLRNPWRFSFDRGRLAIGDVGQDRFEEVDFVAATQRGLNFGWNCFEGFHAFSSCRPPNRVAPVLEYPHTGGRCAITGGYVLRDPAIPRWNGRYVYGDFCGGELHAAALQVGQRTPAGGDADLGLNVSSLTSFGQDARSRVYATSGDGPVYRLVPAP